MVKTDAVDSMHYNIEGENITHNMLASWFDTIPNSDWCILKNTHTDFSNLLPKDKVTTFWNNVNVFHLGVISGSENGGCMYGYFSNYNELEPKAIAVNSGTGLFQGCGIDTVQLEASGGTAYQWSPTQYVDDPYSDKPNAFPPKGTTTKFTVNIKQPCVGWVKREVTITLPDDPTSFFTVDKNQGCAPFQISVQNASTGSTSWKLDWDIHNQDTTATQEIYTYNGVNQSHIFQNHTNAIINYEIELLSTNIYGCPAVHREKIKVYPEVDAKFELVDPLDSVGCHVNNVTFRNQSTGNTDKYLWYYGDGATDNDTLVTHAYENIGLNDTIYKSKLIAISPYNCRDTSTIQNIRVHPYINAIFSVDSTTSCSPIDVNIDPLGSVGVDTFYWHIKGINNAVDSIFTKLSKNPIQYIYTDKTLTSPDTINVSMYAANRFGCQDTATSQQLIVFPEVKALFDVDTKTICDSLPIHFTNNSTGYKLLNHWDFGDGRTAQDITDMDYTRIFRNQTISTKSYVITLQTTSDNLCTSTYDTTIQVHPYIKADFTLDYTNNCTPLDVSIQNQSIRVSNYTWDFGDGTPVDHSSAPTLTHQFWNPLEDSDTTYMIQLAVQNPEGCVDTLERNISLLPQVVAAFVMTDSVGCNPLSIVFSNQSKGKNLYYSWDFAGITSPTNSPVFSRTFNHYGANDSTFNITLTAYNAFGCDSSISKPVTVYAYLDTLFTVYNVDSCSPFKVQISNPTIAGSIFHYWDFGDGSPVSTVYEPSHIYRNTSLAARTDQLRLIVKNNHSCYDTLYRNITTYPEVNTSFAVSNDQGCQPLPVSFTNETNIIPGTNFFWTFQDGTYSTSSNPPSKTYSNTTSSSQFHTIKLEATSQYGCFDDTTVKVEVYPYIFARFITDKSAICSDETFGLDRSGSLGGINSYFWDFGDGETSTRNDAQFNHTYTNIGNSTQTRNIKLTVYNLQGCDTSWSTSLLVHPQVRADFGVDATEMCYPHTFAFNNLSNQGVANLFQWNFGDGVNSSETNPNHFFNNFSNTLDSTYMVTLSATSSYGCDSSISKVITVHPKPKADFNFPVTVDCPPFDVSFSNNSKGTNLSYLWDFDNGNQSLETVPTETFYNNNSDIEERQIRLIATTEFGCKDTSFKPLRIYPNVTVDFNASDWSGCSPSSINLNGIATNESEYYWYVDGRAISTLKDPVYRFVNDNPTDKIFNVQFKALSTYNCMADTTKQITIHPTPVAEFVPDPILQDYNTETDITQVKINNLTFNQPTFNYKWDFGDGDVTEKSENTFLKNYTIWGDINNKNQIPIQMIASNPDHPECRDTIMHNIIINPPVPEIDLAEDIAACVPFTVDFSATTKYIYGDSYQWDFGYNSATSTSPAPEFTYTEPGEYIAKLTVKGDGGYNWDYKKITVYQKPTMDFSFTPKKVKKESQLQPGQPVKFFNHTQQGENYLWLFGDEQNSTELNPSHVYADTGTYYITLIATSTEGCMDTLTSDIPVKVTGEGSLVFPSGIVVDPSGAADEYYDPNESNPGVFRPVASGVAKYKLEIYNRWGVLVFISDDVKKGWNGYIDGKIAKQDVYIWKVKATFTNGEPYIAAGDLTLLVAPTSTY